MQECDGPAGKEPDLPEFLVYNRCQELKRRERESREKAWERELLEAMEASEQGEQQLRPDDAIGNGHKRPGRRKPETQKDKFVPFNDVAVIRECDGESNSESKINEPNISKIKTSNNIHLKPEDKSFSLDFIDRTPSPI